MSAPRRIVDWVRRHPLAADAALAAALVFVVEQDTLTNDWIRGPTALYAAAGLAMTAPLALRGRRPLLVAAIVFGALIVQDLAAGSDARTPDTQLAAWIVAAYSVAAHCDRRGALLGAALALGATVGWVGIDDLLLPVTVIGGALIEEFVRQPRGGDPPPELESLTARELEVLQLLAHGRTNAEIATELVVSRGTAKTHVARVLQKLDLRDRVQAVIFAYEHGLLKPGAAEATPG